MLVVVAFVLAMAAVSTAADPPLRAGRLSGASLETPDGVRRAIAAAAAAGSDTILIPVRLEGEDLSAPFDSAAEGFRAAASQKLRAFASIDVTRAARADEFPGAVDDLPYRHPEWLMVPRDLAIELLHVDTRSPQYLGRLARWTRANAERAANLYISPVHPDAATYVVRRVADVLGRHKAAGVHLDGLGFPGSDFDYSRGAIDTFRGVVRATLSSAERARLDEIEAIDPLAYPEEFPLEWRRFRQERLTELVGRISAAVRAVLPGVIVSVDVTSDAEASLRDHLQDWRSWIEHRLVDAVARRDPDGGAILFSADSLIRPAAVLLNAGQQPAGGTSR